MVFLSIYIFTFILNWYTFDSLQINPVTDKVVKENDEDKEEIITKEINLQLLIKWFFQSFIIYAIFLITTKSEVTEFLIFFTLIILCIASKFILKSISNETYSNINQKLFISNKDYNGININTVLPLHNLTTTGYLLAICVISGFL